MYVRIWGKKNQVWFACVCVLIRHACCIPAQGDHVHTHTCETDLVFFSPNTYIHTVCTMRRNAHHEPHTCAQVGGHADMATGGGGGVSPATDAAVFQRAVAAGHRPGEFHLAGLHLGLAALPL